MDFTGKSAKGVSWSLCYLKELGRIEVRPAEDQFFFDQIEAEALEREDIQRAAKANTFDDFRLVFEKELDDMFIDRMEGNEDIFRRVMQDEEFRAAAGYLMNRIFRQARQSPAGD